MADLCFISVQFQTQTTTSYSIIFDKTKESDVRLMMDGSTLPSKFFTACGLA